MKNFYESFKEHTIEIINYKKNMKLLTNGRKNLYQNSKICYISAIMKNLKMDMLQIRNIVKLVIIVIIQENIEVLKIAYVIAYV